MTENTQTIPDPALPPVPPTPRPPLRRSRTDRVMAGVAGGIGNWLGIDPVIVRVVLVVLAVFGGSGLLLYAIGWLFIPDEGSSASEADRFIGRGVRPGSTTRTVIIVIGAVIAASAVLSILSTGHGVWALGGGGSVLLLLVIGGLVLYLVNRNQQGAGAAPPAAYPPAAYPPAPSSGAAMASATDEDNAASVATVDPVPSTSAPSTSAPTTALPTGFAYGGYGDYPGYPAPVPTPMPPVPPRPRSYLGLATLSVAILVTGILVSLQVTGVTDFAPVIIPGIALLILGTGILIGTWVGRARWLLWFAIPTLFVTMIVSFIPANFDGRFAPNFRAGIGEKFETPTTMLAASKPYELGVGSLQIDLTELTVPDGVITVPVTATVGLGEIKVIVPDDARVLVEADTQLGELRIDGVPKSNDPSPAFNGVLPGSPSDGPVIDLNLHTNIGAVEVSRA
jgi:phage shock protein PspC (stress-responsive transcriptional regulator)